MSELKHLSAIEKLKIGVFNKTSIKSNDLIHPGNEVYSTINPKITIKPTEKCSEQACGHNNLQNICKFKPVRPFIKDGVIITCDCFKQKGPDKSHNTLVVFSDLSD